MQGAHLFIGHSAGGREIAEAMQWNLEQDIIVTTSAQVTLHLSSGVLEALLNSIKNYDFAALILTPDDMVVRQGESVSAPRDTLIFQLGIFIGYLGRERTFVVHPRDKPIELPPELAGINTATYATPERQSLQAALGAVCTRIKKSIGNAPLKVEQERERERERESGLLYPTIYSELRELRAMVGKLIEHSGPPPSAVATEMLEGVWLNTENQSWLYCRTVSGRLRTVYCYRGNDEATGEYYDWQRIGDEWFARFRWLSRTVYGYGWLRIEGNDLLYGGWWYGRDVEEQAVAADPRALRNARGMNPSTWRRQKGVPVPDWAEDYFNAGQWPQ